MSVPPELLQGGGGAVLVAAGWLAGRRWPGGRIRISATTFITANVVNWNSTTSVWLTLTFNTGGASNTLVVTDSHIEKVV
jgi:hypothetical protein